MTDDIDTARYVAFVSRRRDGSPVSTPVWIVPFEDGYAFTTDADAWKVKRILADPSVTIQRCGYRGKPKKDAPVRRGTAEVLSETKVAAVRHLVRRKYWLVYRLVIDRSDRKAARESGSPTAGTAAIKVVLAD